MAQKKISQLTSTSTLTDYDKFPLVQDSITKHIFYKDMKKEMVEDVQREVSTNIDENSNAIAKLEPIANYNHGLVKIGDWLDSKGIYRLICTEDDMSKDFDFVKSEKNPLNNLFGFNINSSEVSSQTNMEIILSAKAHFYGDANFIDLVAYPNNGKWFFTNEEFTKPAATENLDVLIIEYASSAEQSAYIGE